MPLFLMLQQQLPEHLTPRATSESALVLGLFVACVMLIALGRFREKHVFLYLSQAVFFLKPLDDLSKENYKIRSAASVLFLLQFLVITAGTVYWLFFHHTPLSEWRELAVPLLMPGVYFIYQFVMSNLAARISGHGAVVQELNYFTLLLTQFFGLLFLVELFVSYFQQAYAAESLWVLGATYFSYLLIRFLRGFWIVLGQGVPWYYIILYFWTLEILPLLIVAKLLYYDKFLTWIG